MCQDWYQSDFKVLPDQICAGDQNGGRDSCVGDSGNQVYLSSLTESVSN